MEILWPPAPNAIEPSQERLDVWAIRLDWELAARHELVGKLSAAERQRADQFRFDEPRQRFIISRVALRMLFGKYLGLTDADIALEIDSGGKPRLVAGQSEVDLQFNVAHSGDLALVALALGCEVGVDVERERAISHAVHIARRFFHPAETKAILAAPAAERDAVFMRCWTGKEAVLKSLGSGVTGSLASFSVPTHEFSEARIDLQSTLSNTPSHCWLRALKPCAGYIGAVACLGGERRLRLFAFEP